MSKSTLNVGIILTICTTNPMIIPLIITDNTSKIIHMTDISKHSTTNYHTRRHLLNTIDSLIKEYSVDTIIIEDNKLFIDSMDKYPDPYVLRNIILGFSIKTSIEDRYWNTVENIIEIPEYEWKTKVLNTKVKYAIDLYKAHTKLRQFSEKELQIIDDKNYYKAICFSESVLYDTLMNKKYLVNKGD